MRSRPDVQVRTLPTTCYQCNAGPEMLNVRVENGVATEVRPHFESAEVHPGGGKVCVKAYGLIQKAYHPNRVKPTVPVTPNRGLSGPHAGIKPGWRP